MNDGLGIDIGTFNCKIIYFQNDKKKSLDNISSIIKLDVTNENKAWKVVNLNGINGSALKNSIFGVKYLIELLSSASKQKNNFGQYRQSIFPFLSKDIIDNIGSSPYTGVEICTVLFNHIKKEAELHLQKQINNCVVSVPGNNEAIYESVLRQSAKNAGFQKIKIIHELQAACYQLIKQTDKSINHAMIIDFGASTTQVAIINIENKKNKKKYNILSQRRDTSIGGFKIDLQLLNLITKKLDDIKTNSIFSRNQKLILSFKLGQIREFLNDAQEKRIKIGRHSFKLTQNIINKLIQQLKIKIDSLIDLSINESGLTKNDIDKILIIGGFSRTSLIQSIVKSRFNKVKTHVDFSHELIPKGCIRYIHSNRKYSDSIDPLFSWDGIYPYDALEHVNVTPLSSMKEIKNASFVLMANGGMSTLERVAWDNLRVVDKRLMIDFFQYQTQIFENDINDQKNYS